MGSADKKVDKGAIKISPLASSTFKPHITAEQYKSLYKTSITHHYRKLCRAT